MNFIRFVNGYFNKFFEQAINNVPDEYLKFFSSKERETMIKRRSKLMKNASLEEKLYYLAKCGYRFVLMVADIKKEHPALKLLRMFRLFKKKAAFNKKGAVSELKEAGVFVLSDVDFVKSANIISGIYANAELFNLVRDYAGMNEKMHKYFQLHRDAKLEEDAMHGLDDLFASIFRYAAVESGQDFFKNRFNIEAREYIVLAYISKHRFRKIEDIRTYLGAHNIGKFTSSLLEKKMIEATTIVSGERKYDEYYITGLGEVVLNQVRKALLEKFA